MRTHEGPLRAEGRRFGVIASRFNDFIVDGLLTGALDALRRSGAGEEDIEVFRCPGAFEIPGLARAVAETGRFDAVVCLGAVLRGATPHFDLVVSECARGVGALAAESRVAVGFGLLACDTVEQAAERSGKNGENRGFEAAMAAIEMASLYGTLDEERAEP